MEEFGGWFACFILFQGPFVCSEEAASRGGITSQSMSLLELLLFSLFSVLLLLLLLLFQKSRIAFYLESLFHNDGTISPVVVLHDAFLDL